MTEAARKPEDILSEWMRCVRERDLEGVLGLYAEEAVLLPTFSTRILLGPDGMRDYFARLCQRDGLELVLRARTLAVQPAGPGLHLLSGIYRWSMLVDGEPLSFEARFTLLVAPALPRPILHHHSSQVPRGL